ncbi:cbb3-type cytochrome c oxidase subunit I (plasmid) [Natrinema zhouii]|uniref:cbb3-type cytochrome c oxidase subunit I n=1 Tax=Natrinema zhouii TaxID=1710539 RepID=UPI001CFFE399|nr:cbb3-type cytochrome c oxidase subunit I [Natrinema zhouii]UHQ98640.1 cbb3-type cytochrome c oxidase subunit I [Natrinema zhouii]
MTDDPARSASDDGDQARAETANIDDGSATVADPSTDTHSHTDAEPEPAERAGAGDRTDSNDRDDGDEASLGLSLVSYALRLTVAALTAGVRLLRAIGRIGAQYLTDTPSRRRAQRWLLLEGDRLVIVGWFVAGIFAIALLLGVSDVIGVRESRFVTTMFSTMIAGLFSFIPIVVAVNQLIISRLFGTPDRLTDRIDGVQAFRSRVEAQTEGNGVSPTNPAPFLARLAGTLGSRADELATVCDDASSAGEGRSDDSSERSRVADAVDDTPISALESICRFALRTREHTSHLSSRLTGGTESVFAVVLPTIDHDYAGAANEARRLEHRFDEELSARASSLLSELRELFVTADATRQYFTTIYLQRELARLSRLITYSGTAAILLSTLVIMIYASGYPPVAFEGWLLVLVSAVLAVAFSPLAVLFAYVVRISAILKRTSAPGAFTPPGEFHRSYEARGAVRPADSAGVTEPTDAEFGSEAESASDAESASEDGQ